MPLKNWRRLLLGTCLLALGALGAVLWWRRDGRGAGNEDGNSLASPLPAEARDVLLVTIDTLRADALGFAGNREVATPTLDRLAAAGRVYVNAHAHNVLTLPSHINILSGRYPYQHGVRDNSGFHVPAELPTLATILAAAGWQTAAVVGAYPLDSVFGLDRGFTTYDDEYPRGSSPASFVIAERRGDEVVKKALDWWQAHAGGKRFLWVHLYDPHAGYEPPEPWKSRYAAQPYFGEVAATDSFLAPLLGPVLDGKERPAVVVVTADHGEALGDHGELTHGLFAYEATLHVPLVVWTPGITPGRDARWARHVDVLPTILARVGVEAPADLPGRSLLAAAPAAPADSYFESLSTNLNRGWAPLRGLMRGPDKWVDLPLPELYDVAADPAETHNLVDSERRLANELKAALPAESVWPPKKGAVGSEQAASLRSLGYAVGQAPVKTTYTADDDPKRLLGVDRKLHQAIDLYMRGRYEESASMARQVVAERPDTAEGYEHAALALRQLERSDEAIALMREGLTRVVAQESLRRHLAQALAENARAGEAVALLEPYASGGESETRVVLASALSDAGRHAEAIATLDRVLASDPDDPKAHETYGIVLLRMERDAQAREQLQRALQLNPQLPIAWNTLGVALYRLNGAEAALDAWRKAIELDGTQYDAMFNLGMVAAQLGRRDEARGALTRFADTAPPQRFGGDIARARQLLRELGG
ncbi:MAG TPA: sulfatase-like hydrolase/transferase [Thermoanaerobaculia bacterium]|nr:sulfatase-like hydrolase/transferase [Thermoanaerobaculia bacterium]